MQTEKRNKRGFESDKLLLETIKSFQGLSQYELAKKLRWPIGRVDGSIRRLLNKKEILMEVIERNGRRVNLIYPKGSEPSRSVIEIPEKLLHVENPTWLNSAFVYALNSTTIGVSGHEIAEWKEAACFQEEIGITKENEKVVLKIPEKIKRFYEWEQKHRVVSINGNALLITISGNIIEQKKYPS